MAEAAFKRGDYENAVKLFSSIEGVLSSIEKKKLKIAKDRKCKIVENRSVVGKSGYDFTQLS